MVCDKRCEKFSVTVERRDINPVQLCRYCEYVQIGKLLDLSRFFGKIKIICNEMYKRSNLSSTIFDLRANWLLLTIRCSHDYSQTSSIWKILNSILFQILFLDLYSHIFIFCLQQLHCVLIEIERNFQTKV